MEKELDRLGLERQDRERILDLVLEAMIESEREMRLEHGAQILEAILGLRFQEDATIASERARRPLAASNGVEGTAGVWEPRRRTSSFNFLLTSRSSDDQRRLDQLVI